MFTYLDFKGPVSAKIKSITSIIYFYSAMVLNLGISSSLSVSSVKVSSSHTEREMSGAKLMSYN